MQVWDAKQLRCIRILDVHNEVFGLSLAGDYLITGDENGTIVVWNRHTYQRIHTLTDHTGSVYSFVVAGSRLFSASSDLTVMVCGQLSIAEHRHGQLIRGLLLD
jgi:WD40 repeat protein